MRYEGAFLCGTGVIHCKKASILIDWGAHMDFDALKHIILVAAAIAVIAADLVYGNDLELLEDMKEYQVQSEAADSLFAIV